MFESYEIYSSEVKRNWKNGKRSKIYQSTKRLSQLKTHRFAPSPENIVGVLTTCNGKSPPNEAFPCSHRLSADLMPSGVAGDGFRVGQGCDKAGSLPKDWSSIGFARSQSTQRIGKTRVDRYLGDSRRFLANRHDFATIIHLLHI